MIAAGSMHTPGLAEVERAKRDGRWERAYDGARSSTIPAGIAAATDRNPRARAFFEALDGAKFNWIPGKTHVALSFDTFR
jgi:uncharacterized protein YdeI (YjbR/CyaY-like superfamily)